MNNEELSRTSTNDVNDIKNIIDKGRAAAYAAVNTTMIATYWNIGRSIVEEEQHGKGRAEYGKFRDGCRHRTILNPIRQRTNICNKIKLYLPTEEQLHREIEMQKELFLLQHNTTH